MSTVPQYMGCFTLLYADPEVKEQHQYLQPLYGLTADDDPPAPLQLPWGFSQDASASTSSISSSLTSQDDVQGSIAGSQRTASVDEPAAQRHKHSQTTAGALPRPTNSPGAKDDDDSEARQAPTAAPVRPPRKINHVGLSLYPDLVVDPDALQKLQEARRPYPAPQPRSGHVLLPCPERGSLIMFGGLGNVPFNDVWEYDVRTGRWAELPRQCRNMPPPAYGQAASLYQDVNGETCMAILGGISVGDICCSGFFSLNLNRLTWRRVQTTIPFFDMWGATAQTLYAPRRSSVLYTATTPGAAADEERGGDEGNGTRVSAEEQVVVLFGGMTEEGEVVRPVTHLFHFDHRLTAAEIDSNPDMYLKSIEYEKSEYARIMRRVLAEEDIADVHTTGENGLSPSIETRCSQWREAHPNTLMRWRRRALEKMAGKYWVEYLPAPEDLHGRRRSTSAAYKRHFMYIFGGRDDFYFYNDLWCLNLITRTWVQVREGVPPHLLRSFLAEPYNPMYGILINDRGAQLRQETITKTEAKLLHNSTNGTINPMYRARDVHHALFASSVNSSARARTGACMVVDVQRDCLYVYGGFSYTGQQHLTFFDLHAFYIGENVWRRVCICRERPWEVMIDAAADAVGIVNPAEEGRPYARHASPSSAAGAGGQTMGSGAPSLPPTLMGYAARYLQGDPFTTASASGILVAASLGPPLAPRGSRTSRMPNTHSAPGAHRNCFHLPSFVPEARTMAAMVEDPVHPGARFFLHGGRSGEEACGDFFELRTYVGRTVDMEYMKLHRAAREEVVGLVSTRSSAGTNTLATPSASLSNPPATSVTTSFLTAAGAASGLSATDAARLQWNSRRQLQRQLVSAALETQEGFEDMPAAHYSSINDTVPLPRRTLRDAATRWIRDGLAAVDPKSLMFVDTSSAANYTLNARTGTLAGTGSNISASSALATPMQFESMDGHLKRSARSLELLLYDVLLSKPINNGGGAGVGCSGGAARASCHRRTCSSTHMPGIEPATSPSTRGVAMATSPEVLGMFPSYPGSVVGGSPGTSPGGGTPLPTSPQVQIVSRAQYSTPRTPQVLSMTLSGNSGAARDARASGGASPANNEYAYHVLFRSLFHHEPFYRPSYAADKKR
ncbi:Galactose oxidase, central domain family protein [Leishmania donovani]|uniref:Galactose oxidase, central domain family protein n=1 Tax=Leishmania donovani TaxID=5661 RepID=A0A504XFV4_LEIDO|nr:Galactose oxidase, central domain family protein [Leishmania donovani]